MTKKSQDDETVGYGKPPKAKQFKKGESGNPKGRPKGAKNFSTALESELKSLIEITENGKKKKISKKEAIAKQIVHKAVSGDHRAFPIILNEMRHREEIESTTNLRIGESSEDQIVMESVLQRFRKAEAFSLTTKET